MQPLEVWRLYLSRLAARARNMMVEYVASMGTAWTRSSVLEPLRESDSGQLKGDACRKLCLAPRKSDDTSVSYTILPAFCLNGF